MAKSVTRKVFLSLVMAFFCLAGLRTAWAGACTQRTYADVIFHICPEPMPAGCTHRVTIENNTYPFEGATAEATAALKAVIRGLQARGRTRSAPLSIRAFFIFKSGIWPRPETSQDVVEILSLNRSFSVK